MDRDDLSRLRRSRGWIDATERRLRRAFAMTEAELLAAQAGTGRIGPPSRVLGSSQRHYVGRRAVPLQKLGHRLHRRTCVREEQLQAGAEIVLAGIAVAGECEAILRASAIT